MAANVQTRLSGLPRRLVQEGVINESIAAEAETEAQKSAGASIVTYLVEKNLADARDIAGAACHEFGVPVLDLDAIEIELETARLIDERLMQKHRVLPLFRRGRRVFVGVSDPTRLQAIDEIKFATGMSIEAIVVEENKLDATIARLSEALDTTMDSLGGEDLDLENLDVAHESDDAAANLTRDEIDDAPIVRFVNKVLLDAIHKGASDIHFEPYEKFYRVRTRLDGVLKEVARPPVALANKVTARIKVMSRHGHRRAAHSTGRAHQAEACPPTAPSISASTHCRRCTARRSCCVSSTRARRSSASMRWATRNSRSSSTSTPCRNPTA